MNLQPDVILRDVRFEELDAGELYELLRLRVDVFVVEQRCPYHELDGRDREPAARHCFFQREGRVVAALRVLREPDGSTRMGRVVTAPEARRQGLASRLVTHALHDTARPVVLDAQTPQVRWYERFGFEVCGDEFLDDGIPHVPMRLA